MADALATGVFVLGAEAGMDLIESQPTIEGLIVDVVGGVHISTGLNGDFGERKGL